MSTYISNSRYFMGPSAMNLLQTGQGYVGSDGLVHRYDERQRQLEEWRRKHPNQLPII